MPNNYLSVLYKHIIQVENENVGLKVCVCVGGGGGHKHTIALNKKKWGGGHMSPLPPLPTSVLMYITKHKIPDLLTKMYSANSLDLIRGYDSLCLCLCRVFLILLI